MVERTGCQCARVGVARISVNQCCSWTLASSQRGMQCIYPALFQTLLCWVPWYTYTYHLSNHSGGGGRRTAYFKPRSSRPDWVAEWGGHLKKKKITFSNLALKREATVEAETMGKEQHLLWNWVACLMERCLSQAHCSCMCKGSEERQNTQMRLLVTEQHTKEKATIY